LGDPRKEISDEEHRDARRPYYFKLKRELSIDDHMNNYTKLLGDLVNTNVAIEKKTRR